MIIPQLSVFLENKKGRLSAAADVIAAAGINIRALTLADTAEFGILRILVDRPEDARRALSESGVVVRITNVIAIAMEDVPGGANSIIHLLSDAGLNIEYLYACVGQKSGKALMVIRTNDIDGTEALLKSHGYDKLEPADVYEL